MRNNIEIVKDGMSEGFTGKKTTLAESKWDELYNALEAGTVMQGTINGAEENSLVIFIGDIKGIIPNEEIGNPRPKRLGALVGAPVFFKVKHCDRRENTVYLSRKEALDEMSNSTWQELRKICAPLVKIQDQMEKIRGAEKQDANLTDEQKAELRHLGAKARKIGPIRTGTVRSVFAKGAFLDIGGVAAFLPAHELSWGHVEDARTVDGIIPGRSFDVRIIRVNFDTAWVRVSLKATMPDPWEAVPQRYVRNGIYSAVFKRTTAKGKLILELEPGVNVMCGRLPMQKLDVGQAVRVRILNINPDQKLIWGTISGMQSWGS